MPFADNQELVEVDPPEADAHLHGLRVEFSPAEAEEYPLFDSQDRVSMLFLRFASFGNHLKEYYEIVGESRPLSAFFPTHADFFTEMHFYS